MRRNAVSFLSVAAAAGPAPPPAPSPPLTLVRITPTSHTHAPSVSSRVRRTTASFAKLVIFSIFEMRLLLIVWKSQRPDAFNSGWATMRRELLVLYSRFYCVLLLGIALIFQIADWVRYLAIPAALIWLPQIYTNAAKVSLLLCTVTLHANHAHNLTRSP